jgi:hypothetical protein
MSEDGVGMPLLDQFERRAAAMRRDRLMSEPDDGAISVAGQLLSRREDAHHRFKALLNDRGGWMLRKRCGVPTLDLMATPNLAL